MEKYIKPKKVYRQVQTIHESQDTLNEVDRFLYQYGRPAGLAYVEAIQLLIAREKKAGRYV